MATISEAIRIAESHQQAGRLSEAEQIFRQVVGAEIPPQIPAIPPESLWYSEDPYIDHDVRLKRMERIYETLCKNGVRFGPPALRTIEECLHGQVPDGGGEYRRRETLPNADAEMAATPAEGANMR